MSTYIPTLLDVRVMLYSRYCTGNSGKVAKKEYEHVTPSHPFGHFNTTLNGSDIDLDNKEAS